MPDYIIRQRDRGQAEAKTRGRGQSFEAEAEVEAKILASRPLWPWGLNIIDVHKLFVWRLATYVD